LRMESIRTNDDASSSPLGINSDKPQRKRKLPAKFRQLPGEETHKQYKTPQNKKLVLGGNESDKKRSTEALKEPKDAEGNFETASNNNRHPNRKSTGGMEKAPVIKRARPSIDSWASLNRHKSAAPPRDQDLPQFDPEKFSPGYVPKSVKKGDEEYVIVVTGVPDTGLCGKYWGDVSSLQSSRRQKNTCSPLAATNEKTAKESTRSVDLGKPTKSSETKNKIYRTSTDGKPSTTSENDETSATMNPKKSQIKQTPSDKSRKSVALASSAKKNKVESMATSTPKQMAPGERKQKQEATEVEKAPQFKQRMTEPKQSQQLDVKAFLDWDPELELTGRDENGTEPQQFQEPTGPSAKKKSDAALTANQNKVASAQKCHYLLEIETKDTPFINESLEVKLPTELTDETSSVASEHLKGDLVDVINTVGSSPLDKNSKDSTESTPSSDERTSGHQGKKKSVNTPVEVMVECLARRQDSRWINMGNKTEIMAPDSVQYTRALRPPYHLVSFLRMKGHSCKGLSRSDKNTIVFVVMEGEVSVTIHTSQFNAKKGDSFYVPPKNTYNLINQKETEAELSLIQFQYEGPLPTSTQYEGAPSTSTQTDNY